MGSEKTKVVAKRNGRQSTTDYRPPGRPRTVDAQASAKKRSWLEFRNARRRDHVVRDPVVQALEGDGSATDVLYAVRAEIAAEAASLKWELDQGRSEARHFERTLSRRIDALSKLAAIELGLRRLGVSTLDARSPQMQSVFQLFFDTVRDVCDGVLPDEHPFLERLHSALQGWEARVSK